MVWSHQMSREILWRFICNVSIMNHCENWNIRMVPIIVVLCIITHLVCIRDILDKVRIYFTACIVALNQKFDSEPLYVHNILGQFSTYNVTGPSCFKANLQWSWWMVPWRLCPIQIPNVPLEKNWWWQCRITSLGHGDYVPLLSWDMRQTMGYSSITYLYWYTKINGKIYQSCQSCQELLQAKV